MQLKYVQLNLFKIIIECAFCVSVMNASIDNVLNAGAGHTPQLLRQSDTVFKANKLLSVTLPLNIESKLHFVFLYFSIYVFALPRYLWRVATRNVKICCRPALQNVQCFCVWEGVSGRGLFFTVHSAFSIQCTRFYFMQYIHAILIRID